MTVSSKPSNWCALPLRRRCSAPLSRCDFVIGERAKTAWNAGQTAGLLIAACLLIQAWRWNSAFGASLSAVYAGLAFRISMMDLL